MLPGGCRGRGGGARNSSSWWAVQCRCSLWFYGVPLKKGPRRICGLFFVAWDGMGSDRPDGGRGGCERESGLGDGLFWVGLGEKMNETGQARIEQNRSSDRSISPRQSQALIFLPLGCNAQQKEGARVYHSSFYPRDAATGRLPYKQPEEMRRASAAGMRSTPKSQNGIMVYRRTTAR